MISLDFTAGDSLEIHSDLLRRTPKLAMLDLDAAAESGRWLVPGMNPQLGSLKRISRSAGHVLVQYLYADSYRTPKWVGPTDGQTQTIALLEVAFEVYATAREFDLEGLEALARVEISRLSKGVDAFSIVDIVKKAYPCAKGNDTWLPVFIKGAVRAAFETPLPPLPGKAASETTAIDDASVGAQKTADDVALAKLLLQVALDVHREKMDASEQAQPGLGEAKTGVRLTDADSFTTIKFARKRKIKSTILEETQPVPEVVAEEKLPGPPAEEASYDEPRPKPEPEASKGLEPVPVEKLSRAPAQQVLAISPVEQGWAGGESDSWSSGYGVY